MKAFLWAVAACVVISIGAAAILSWVELTGSDDSRTASSVRLD